MPSTTRVAPSTPCAARRPTSSRRGSRAWRRSRQPRGPWTRSCSRPCSARAPRRWPKLPAAALKRLGTPSLRGSRTRGRHLLRAQRATSAATTALPTRPASRCSRYTPKPLRGSPLRKLARPSAEPSATRCSRLRPRRRTSARSCAAPRTCSVNGRKRDGRRRRKSPSRAARTWPKPRRTGRAATRSRCRWRSAARRPASPTRASRSAASRGIRTRARSRSRRTSEAPAR
mmetsp:Transcript_4329/g.12810  ORF Transcript_4329/g.12810 Transcript_4329/m.12810 type:complete len:230 (-) Transcript_4329:157-846(-)